MDKYIFTNKHEIFFASLSSELHEWLSKLVETKCYTRSDKPTEWTSEAIEVLKKVDNLDTMQGTVQIRPLNVSIVNDLSILLKNAFCC